MQSKKKEKSFPLSFKELPGHFSGYELPRLFTFCCSGSPQDSSSHRLCPCRSSSHLLRRPPPPGDSCAASAPGCRPLSPAGARGLRRDTSCPRPSPPATGFYLPTEAARSLDVFSPASPPQLPGASSALSLTLTGNLSSSITALADISSQRSSQLTLFFVFLVSRPANKHLFGF